MTAAKPVTVLASKQQKQIGDGEGSHRHRLRGTPPNQFLLRVNSAAKSADGAPVHVSAEGTPPHAARFFMSTSLDNSDTGDGGSGTPSAATKHSAAVAFSLELLILRLYQLSSFSDHIPLELLRALAAGGTPTKQLVYDSAVKSDDGSADHGLSSTSKLSTSIGADSRLLNYAVVKKAANVFTFWEFVTTMVLVISVLCSYVVKAYNALEKSVDIVETFQKVIACKDKVKEMKEMVRKKQWKNLVFYILTKGGGSESSDEDEDGSPKSTN